MMKAIIWTLIAGNLYVWEKRIGWFWNVMCPEKEVSYWFDFAPAMIYRWRKAAEFKAYKARTGEDL